MKKLLFLNACINMEKSRTYRIAKAFIAKAEKSGEYDIMELLLEDEFIKPLTSETLNKRFGLIMQKDFNDKIFDYSKQFKEADIIVVAAPYWDFGFPAILKTYIEAISVMGLLFEYGEGGRPIGLCNAEKLYYITTRGGYIGDEKDLGYATMVQLTEFYGIKGVECIGMDGFDIPINNPDELVEKAILNLPNKI